MLKTYTKRTPEQTRRKLAALQKRAAHAVEYRGHNLGDWETGRMKGRATAHCTLCGAWVQVIAHPAPNEINIGGEAVAVGHVDIGHPHKANKAGRQVCCKVCHICGAELTEVLDGELWCAGCYRYR